MAHKNDHPLEALNKTSKHLVDTARRKATELEKGFSKPSEQAWLVSENRVLAALELPVSWTRKAKGLLGRDKLEGAIFFSKTKSVHSFGMKFEIDIAFLDSEMKVIKCMRLTPNRIALPVWKASSVVEAQAGAFSRWGLNVGDVVEVRLVGGTEYPKPVGPVE